MCFAFWSEMPVTVRLLDLDGSDCRIKGNVSLKTGERIYHVPGQTYYDGTRVSIRHGERWFCTELEARQAGWRRAWR